MICLAVASLDISCLAIRHERGVSIVSSVTSPLAVGAPHGGGLRRRPLVGVAPLEVCDRRRREARVPLEEGGRRDVRRLEL